MVQGLRKGRGSGVLSCQLQTVTGDNSMANMLDPRCRAAIGRRNRGEGALAAKDGMVRP